MAKRAESVSNITRIKIINKVFILLHKLNAFPAFLWTLASYLNRMLPQVHLLLNVPLMFTLWSEFGSDGNVTIPVLLHRIADLYYNERR